MVFHVLAPRTINVKECFKFVLIVVLGGFQFFRKVVPQRPNSVEEGTSEIGSSAKVGSVAVDETEASLMMVRVVDIIFGGLGRGSALNRSTV
jgi:NADH:ubiquinone oxidoreductase subunit F (NADH-binding)